jgi:hypothetical protein
LEVVSTECTLLYRKSSSFSTINSLICLAAGRGQGKGICNHSGDMKKRKKTVVDWRRTKEQKNRRNREKKEKQEQEEGRSQKR